MGHASDGDAGRAAEVRAAVDEVDGIGLVVGPGGLLPLDVPDTNVVALVKAAGGQTRLVL
jgi:hypothetical protein